MATIHPVVTLTRFFYALFGLGLDLLTHKLPKTLRKIRKRLKEIVFNWRYLRFQNLSSDHHFSIGSINWLIHREIIYGGIQKNVHRKKISVHDPRVKTGKLSGRMQGGDRMLFHGYAKNYSKYLKMFDQDRKLIVAEFGILRGNGLAIWCDLFPNARVLGFDIDTSNFEDNKQYLLDRGAFSSNFPEIHTYDLFVPSRDLLGQILEGDKIDICIDDGCHLNEAILCTMKSVMPHINEKFVYFVEDNKTV